MNERFALQVLADYKNAQDRADYPDVEKKATAGDRRTFRKPGAKNWRNTDGTLLCWR